jgi:hypothetical protein
MGTLTAVETKIDQLIFKIVVEKNGASNMYREILDDMSELLTPTKVTRIIRGSSSSEMPLMEMRVVHEVLKRYKPDLTYEQILNLFA